jgi:hypothetical protein
MKTLNNVTLSGLKFASIKIWDNITLSGLIPYPNNENVK